MKASVCHMHSKLKKAFDGMVGEMYSSLIASANTFKNTLQASQAVRRWNAQTGGFIFWVTVSNTDLQAMGLPDDWREREPWVGVG